MTSMYSMELSKFNLWTFLIIMKRENSVGRFIILLLMTSKIQSSLKDLQLLEFMQENQIKRNQNERGTRILHLEKNKRLRLLIKVPTSQSSVVVLKNWLISTRSYVKMKENVQWKWFYQSSCKYNNHCSI